VSGLQAAPTPSDLKDEGTAAPATALPAWLRRVSSVIAVVMSAYHIWTGLQGAPEAMIHRSIHLAFALTLIFLLHPGRSADRERKDLHWDLALLVLSLASIGYIFLTYENIVTRFPYVHPLSSWDMLFGGLLALLVLEGTRRCIGPALPITAIVFLIYAYTGPYLPGALRHRGFTLETIIDQTFMTTEGIFGIPLAVSATYVILFVIFGAFLEKSGTGQLFMDFASSLTGHTPGGPGKISCISSGLFGTISGSAVANVMVDGWLTIPLMKKAGFRSHFAAAVEAVASTGGQIMPPVMGAGAFVMAEFLGVPYIQIALHAAIPALLYYVALFMAIHYEALRTGLRGVPREELPILKAVLLSRGHLFLPICLLVYMMTLGYTAPYAALWATGGVILLSWLRTATRLNLKTVWQALEDGAKNTLAVASACACAGIIIGVISLTGLGLKFTSFVLSIAGFSLIPALAFTMLTGVILGMGMPTTAAYIMQAALLIPALIKLGVMPIAAHLFVFYFAIISAITPPVALAVYAAAGISRSNLWNTGLAAVRLGATGFIVPFMFVYGPSLLFVGSWGEILTTAISASIGVIALAGGLHGWFLTSARLWERLALLAGAFLLIKPGLYTDTVGLILLALVGAAQKLRAPEARLATAFGAGLPRRGCG
jgi:TRAP transporter 4TM/12TM fusion protein